MDKRVEVELEILKQADTFDAYAEEMQSIDSDAYMGGHEMQDIAFSMMDEEGSLGRLGLDDDSVVESPGIDLWYELCEELIEILCEDEEE